MNRTFTQMLSQWEKQKKTKKNKQNQLRLIFKSKKKNLLFEEPPPLAFVFFPVAC